MTILGPEPSQEGQMWATSRVPVDGATITSDIRASSCREQKTRWNAIRDVFTTLALFAKAKDDDGPSKSLFNVELLQLHISLIVKNAS
ncbi:hypothetical protein AVEN_198761-1 [Araneus ventricosus]|uniref:Uncharacterized protein n=1 Tax=Araneus ventricosus TaxID=182803 RepID=A0A4Y2KJX4_ARAVE|nr:hypothetical protein AVEN_198761-1 [Araneus ventricosus]